MIKHKDNTTWQEKVITETTLDQLLFTLELVDKDEAEKIRKSEATIEDKIQQILDYLTPVKS